MLVGPPCEVMTAFLGLLSRAPCFDSFCSCLLACLLGHRPQHLEYHTWEEGPFGGEVKGVTADCSETNMACVAIKRRFS